jgi:hypothetical protein
MRGASHLRVTNQFQEGSIERSKDGKILAYLKIGRGYRKIDEFNRTMGLEIFEMETAEPEISTDASSPTLFSGRLDSIIRRGAMLYDIGTGRTGSAPVEMKVSSMAVARATLVGSSLAGLLELEINIPVLPRPVRAIGEFQVSLE